MLWAWEKFYSSVVDKWLKCLSTFFVFLQCSCCKTQPVTPKEDELTELIVAFLTNRRDQQRQKGEGEKKKKDQTKSNKDKKKKKKRPKSFLWAKFWMRGGEKKRNLQGHTTEVASSKSFYPRCPWEEPQRNSCNGKPWLLMKGFCLEAGRRTTWSRRKSIVFPLKGKKPRRSCTMVCGTYQNIWQTSALWKKKNPPSSLSLFFFLRRGFVFPPTADPSHSHQAPWLARVIVWAPRVQSEPFRSRSVCADTM